MGNNLLKPNSLKTGDTIAIICTAGKISFNEIAFAVEYFKKLNLKILIGETIGAEYYQFAGTDDLRRLEFQKMIDDENVKAIICARGGYGTIRIMEDLNFTNFTKSPKWIVGYSDVCVLHTFVNNYLGIQSIHATMPINFEENTKESLDTLKKALFNKPITYTIKPNQFNIMGKTTGEIIGGNLSILYSLLGTKTAFNTDGKILFLEDLDEQLYHIDRMIISLKNAGKFNKLKALIIGGISTIQNNIDKPFGKSVQNIIIEHCKEYNFPICFNFPSGHQKNNQAIIFGKKSMLTIEKKKVFLTYL